jgi:hypothetical protein
MHPELLLYLVNQRASEAPRACVVAVSGPRLAARWI